MPLTIFFGLLTLAPLVMALALAGLGQARRATTGVALGLTLAGVVIPIIGLAALAPEVSAGFPLEIALLGDQTSWVALYGRADALSIYAAIGVAVIVAPMLLWLAWRAAPLDAAEEAALGAATERDEATDETTDETTAGDDEAAEMTTPVAAAPAQTLGRWQWMGVALALALETLALWVCFAENIALLGIVWIALIVVAWGLGELGSEAGILDWRGLSLMVVGPVIWLVTVLLIAGPIGARRLLDLTGAGRLPVGHVFVIALALVFAAGAYPALAWLRKRASIATPAGLAAVSLAIMPAALFVGVRTYSIGATLTGGWPSLNIGKPSLTIGITLTLLGALSVAIAGLLALGRRDPRSLIASLTLAQAGWGLLGLGVGAPLSQLGITLLLATSVIGLGAVIASLVAAGAITADVEPDSAGPRILGEPLRPALMFAWLAGVATLIGVPLLAGFAPLQLISAETLTGPRLSIPLVGLAWIGSALLGIAFVRATAPAFTAPLIAVYASDEDFADEEGEEDDEAGDEEAPEASAQTGVGDDSEATASDETETEEAEDEEAEKEVPVPEAPELRLEEAPGIALGTLAVIAGVAPGVALTLASAAAGTTVPAGVLDTLVRSSSSGYTAGVGQWFVTAPVIFVAVVSLALAYARTRMPREIRPLYLAGQEPAATTTGETAEAAEAAEALAEMGEVEGPAELVALPEPTETWSDLSAVRRSGWLTPGAAWLGLDNEEGESDDSGDSGDKEKGGDAAPDDATEEEPEATDGARANSAAPLHARSTGAPSGVAPEATGEQA